MSEPSALWTFFPLLPLKLRNAALDMFFYDIGSLSPAEIARLMWIDAQKGSVVVVSPTKSPDPIRYYQKALRFILKEKEKIRAVVVAGVGSSILGAAALARNVADALDEDVAAIISGYGVADVLGEALGGWFLFGTSDRIHRAADDILQKITHPLSAKPAPRGEVTIPSSFLDPSSPGFGLPGDEDAVTLSDILIAKPTKLDLLVGHSKGSLIISTALAEYAEAAAGMTDSFDEKLRIVTFGAVSDVPARFQNVTQFLGEIDWFGGMNSRLDLPDKRLPLAWHHLNRFLPFHVDAVSCLQSFK